MRRLLLILGLISLFVAGCGGGGGGGSNGGWGGVASPFVGEWTTSFDGGEGDRIVLHFTIARSGSMDGEAYEVGEDGALRVSRIAGKATTEGQVTVTVRHPDGTTETVTGTATLEGSKLLLSLVPQPNQTLLLTCLPPYRDAEAGTYSGTLDLGEGGRFQVTGTLDDAGRFTGTFSLEGQAMRLRFWLSTGDGISVAGYGSRASSNEQGAVFRGEASLGEDEAGRKTIDIVIHQLQTFNDGRPNNAAGTLALKRG